MKMKLNELAQGALSAWGGRQMALPRGRLRKGYEKQVIGDLQAMLKAFQTEAKKSGGRMNSITVAPPGRRDDDWLRLALLVCWVCGARYVPEKTAGSGVFCLRIYGEGQRSALSAQLLALLWPLFVQFRRRNWQHHMRSRRQQAGAAVQVTPAERRSWRQQYGAQWVQTLWQTLQEETLSPSEEVRLRGWRQHYDYGTARTLRGGKGE